MAKDEDDKLPDKDAAREFYAKYEPKEILGRYFNINYIKHIAFCVEHFSLVLTM